MAKCESCKQPNTGSGPYCPQCTRQKSKIANDLLGKTKKEHNMRYRGIPTFDQFMEDRDTKNKAKGCSSCGSLATGPDGLCWKCSEQKKRNKKTGGRGEFYEDRQAQDIGTESMSQPGTFQIDGEKPDPDADLASALEEIIELAKKALEMREKGLGDENPNQPKGSDNQDGAPMSNLVQRSKADGPEALFGGDQ